MVSQTSAGNETFGYVVVNAKYADFILAQRSTVSAAAHQGRIFPVGGDLPLRWVAFHYGPPTRHVATTTTPGSNKAICNYTFERPRSKCARLGCCCCGS